MNSNKKAVRLITEICKAKGIRKVVFSPGSRSAPLVIAFTQTPEIECLVIPDERVAGYFALGMAQQLREPVAIVCTSGTAVLNLSPAVCEAWHQKIPLLVITADRPESGYWRGDNQAIRLQEKSFSGHVGEAFSINGDETEEETLQKMVYDFQIAFARMKKWNEPLHLNIRMDEPLYIQEEKTDEVISLSNTEHYFDSVFEEDGFEEFKSKVSIAQKKLVIVGMHQANDNFQTAISKIAERDDTVVLIESLSNIYDKNCIENYDACIELLRKESNTDFLPDVVITFGTQLISKKIRQLLRKHKTLAHWHIPAYGKDFFDYFNAADPVDYAWELPYIKEQHALDAMLNAKIGHSNYRSNWQSLNAKGHQLFEAYCASVPFSDLKVFETLIKSFPESAHIQYGNSTPIRYSNFFTHHKSHVVNANRGTSGIDGCVSTSAGAAYVNQQITISVVGDVSFFYDSNALWNNYLSPHFRIVVVNNGGGNIFRMIDGPTSVNNFEKFFETKHNLSAKHIASMYHLPYYICDSQNGLEECLKTFYDLSDKPKILEVKTDGVLSAKFFKDYFNLLRKYQ